MPESKDPDRNTEKPPLFGTWRKAYCFVALFFIAEVALFFLFTRFYS